MEHGTFLSIVMPVYNRAALLPRVAGSVLAQTYRNFEFIIVDDCSSDDIEAAVAALGDDRVRLVRRTENGGAAAARNTGVAAAKSEWIVFHDSDDFCTTDRLELCVQELMGLPEDYIGVYGARVIYNEVSAETYGKAGAFVIPRGHERNLAGDLATRSMHENIINLPTLMIKKSAFEEAGGFDTVLRQNEDWDLCLRLTQLGKIGFVPEPLLLTPTSQDDNVSAARVSRSRRQGARSFMRISRKLKARGLSGSPLARHYSTTGRYLMMINRPLAARRFFGAALKENGGDLRVFGHYCLSFAPGWHARLRKPAKI